MFLYSSLASKAIVRQLSGSSHFLNVTASSEDKQPGIVAVMKKIITNNALLNLLDINITLDRA